MACKETLKIELLLGPDGENNCLIHLIIQHEGGHIEAKAQASDAELRRLLPFAIPFAAAARLVAFPFTDGSAQIIPPISVPAALTAQQQKLVEEQQKATAAMVETSKAEALEPMPPVSESWESLRSDWPEKGFLFPDPKNGALNFRCSAELSAGYCSHHKIRKPAGARCRFEAEALEWITAVKGWVYCETVFEVRFKAAKRLIYAARTDLELDQAERAIALFWSNAPMPEKLKYAIKKRRDEVITWEELISAASTGAQLQALRNSTDNDQRIQEIGLRTVRLLCSEIVRCKDTANGKKIAWICVHWDTYSRFGREIELQSVFHEAVELSRETGYELGMNDSDISLIEDDAEEHAKRKEYFRATPPSSLFPDLQVE